MNRSEAENLLVEVALMDSFVAIRASDARRYGGNVKAAAFSNRDYLRRFNELGSANNMKPPPGSHIHIMPGFLVVRKLGTPAQYETWMPEDVFEELYQRETDR